MKKVNWDNWQERACGKIAIKVGYVFWPLLALWVVANYVTGGLI